MSIETEQYQGHTIEVDYDSDPISPREDDNICVFHIAHRNYSFGDKNYNSFESIEEARKQALRNKDIVLPLYMLDHSGITISLSPFSCPWDSNQVGFVQIPREKMIKEFSKKNFTKALKQKGLDIAKLEVKVLDNFIRGEVYSYAVDGDVCGGFYSVEDAIEYAKNEIVVTNITVNS